MYKLKKGYVLGNDFQQVVNRLKDDVDITWYEPIKITNQTKIDTIFWTNINELLKSDYVLVNSQQSADFELGIAWTINYIRKLLTRSGHKSAVKQLDKFGLVEKNIVGLNINNTNNLIQVTVKDQGKEFKSVKAIVSYIKTKEK